ncbi:uncharacterized protein zgc:56622 isoform X2 [Nerophis ophidion]|uniref:uncharacterized protein zgc:56622 isoform X2 n=1 Tax=Nerophis ophidion TaxID=159077 RepID=UPI002AE04C9F|nr:uncharacterized protein zgc:56622 isoform X2 [Nerophis ophidion]
MVTKWTLARLCTQRCSRASSDAKTCSLSARQCTCCALEDIPKCFNTSLTELQLDYLDLFLLQCNTGLKKTSDDFFRNEGTIFTSDVDYVELWRSGISVHQSCILLHATFLSQTSTPCHAAKHLDHATTNTHSSSLTEKSQQKGFLANDVEEILLTEADKQEMFLRLVADAQPWAHEDEEELSEEELPPGAVEAWSQLLAKVADAEDRFRPHSRAIRMSSPAPGSSRSHDTPPGTRAPRRWPGAAHRHAQKRGRTYPSTLTDRLAPCDFFSPPKAHIFFPADNQNKSKVHATPPRTQAPPQATRMFFKKSNQDK